MNSNPIKYGKKIYDIRAEKLFREANELFYLKKYNNASILLNQVLDIDKKHTKAFLLLGDIKLLTEGCEFEALEAYDNAILSNPYSTQAYGSKAYVLDILGKYKEAFENCEKAFEYVNKNDNDQLCSLYDQKISLLCSLKRYDEADKTLSDAIENLSEDNANYLHSCYSQKISMQQKEKQKAKQPDLKLIF